MASRFLVLFFIFFSVNASACFAPIQGEKYDALIVIKKIGKNHYAYEFPSEVNGYKNDGTVILALSQEESGSFMADSTHQIIHPKEINGTMKGEFTIPDNENNGFLLVSWPPKEECCMCAYLGFTKLLIRE